MQKKFILFDFDGVIADTFAVAFETKRVICPHVTEEEYRREFIGNVFDWKDDGDGHTVACQVDANFSEIYVPRMRKQAKIFAGMFDVVTALEKDFHLVVVSSTITSPIEEFLTRHNLASHFAWIMGADVHKSKVEKIKMVFEKYLVTPDDCVFITDTLGDMHEAEKTGVRAIGVLWGFHNSETLARGNSFRLVETPSELPAAVYEYFSKVRGF